MARTQDIQDGTFRATTAARVSRETYLERTLRAEPREGDLLYSREGTYFGTAAEVPADVNVCLGQRMVLLRPDQAQIVPRFLRYWLNAPRMQAHIHGLRAGSVAERLNLGAIRKLPVIVPPLSVQEYVAGFLGALDDKIELNRKMSRTLEEIAQTLFRAWFVDFEGETDLVESELGPIPRGWGVALLEELAGLVQETVRPDMTPDAIWEHFSIPAFDKGKLPHRQRGSEIKSSKYRVPADSVLISKLNPRFPRVWRVKVAEAELAVCSTEFLPFVARERQLRPYLYELLSSESVTAAVQSRVTGTTGSRQRVKPRDVAKLPIPLPPDGEALRDFSRRVAPIHDRKQLNLDEAATLAQLRDTLLPKLISGEIRVPEAEARVEEAV